VDPPTPGPCSVIMLRCSGSSHHFAAPPPRERSRQSARTVGVLRTTPLTMSASPMRLHKPGVECQLWGWARMVSHPQPDRNQVIANGVCVQAFVPPSTVRFAPVMYEASGLAMNATRDATSSTFPNRPRAVLAI
jgi:hypothetical protein